MGLFAGDGTAGGNALAVADVVAQKISVDIGASWDGRVPGKVREVNLEVVGAGLEGATCGLDLALGAVGGLDPVHSALVVDGSQEVREGELAVRLDGDGRGAGLAGPRGHVEAGYQPGVVETIHHQVVVIAEVLKQGVQFFSVDGYSLLSGDGAGVIESAPAVDDVEHPLSRPAGNGHVRTLELAGVDRHHSLLPGHRRQVSSGKECIRPDP